MLQRAMPRQRASLPPCVHALQAFAPHTCGPLTLHACARLLCGLQVLLFLLASHGTDFRRQPLGLNLLVRFQCKLTALGCALPVALHAACSCAVGRGLRCTAFAPCHRWRPSHPCSCSRSPLQVVVVLTIAKMSSMHKVRIFGINKD